MTHVNPFLVVNPRSNGGATGRSFGAMKPIIERGLGPVEFAMTEGTIKVHDYTEDNACPY